MGDQNGHSTACRANAGVDQSNLRRKLPLNRKSMQNIDTILDKLMAARPDERIVFILPHSIPLRDAEGSPDLKPQKAVIQHILAHQELPAEIVLVFPEVWMNWAEQESFMTQLRDHPKLEKVKRVTLVTQSPHIILGAQDGEVFLAEVQDDEVELIPATNGPTIPPGFGQIQAEGQSLRRRHEGQRRYRR